MCTVWPSLASRPFFPRKDLKKLVSINFCTLFPTGGGRQEAFKPRENEASERLGQRARNANHDESRQPRVQETKTKDDPRETELQCEPLEHYEELYRQGTVQNSYACKLHWGRKYSAT